MSTQNTELLKDFRKLRRLEFFDDAKVVARFERGDFTDFRFAILPVHGFFRNCLVRFKIKFNNYPTEKPKPECLTKIFHPNISSSGGVCYSMFDDHWTQDFRLKDYINAAPNHGSPLNSSCVEKDEKKFDEFVQQGARGQKAKGTLYDYCHVNTDIKTSEELGKILDQLVAFLDRKKIPFEIEKKINDFYQKIQNVESESMRLFMKFIAHSETLNNLCGALKTFAGDKFGEFDSEKFLEAKLKVEAYLRKCDLVFEYELKMDTFMENLFKRFKKRDGRVYVSFDKAFQPVREACDKMYGFINDEVQIHKDMTLCGDSINRFLGKCRDWFELEKKVDVYQGRVRERFSKTGSLFKKFEDNEFKILEDELTRLYPELNTNPDQKNLQEGIKMIRDIRRTAKVVLQLEHDFLHFCTQLHTDFGEKEGYREELPWFDPFKKEIRDILDTLHPRIREEMTKLEGEKLKIAEVMKKMTDKAEEMRKKLREEEAKNKPPEPGDVREEIQRKKRQLEQMLRKRLRVLRRRRNRNNENNNDDDELILE